MTTQLEDHGTHWVVKTVESQGKRRRMGRLGVHVPKGDPDALRAEITKQAVQLRFRWGVAQKPPKPVV